MSEFETRKLIEADPALKEELRQLIKQFKLSELGNAERLVARHGKDIR